MKRRWMLVATGCGLAVWVMPCNAVSWNAVPSQSHLSYVATYERQQAPGIFRQFEVRFDFNPQQPRSGRLYVRVDLRSADMNSRQVNEAIKGAQWLATHSNPWAEFESETIRRAGPSRFIAVGTLSMKGARHTIEVPFTWQTRDSTAVLEGQTTVDRATFNVGTGEWAPPGPIGATVQVEYRVTFEKGR